MFSLHPELRILSWGGAMLLATAAGMVLKNNLDRIGPLALAVLMGIAAATCYAFVWWRRARPSVVHDYVVLLGALLISADVAFIESQFHLLGSAWHRHFLILAIVHGAAAYLFRSRLVLSLSIVAVTAWLGVREKPFRNATDYAMRAFACAALLLMWRRRACTMGRTAARLRPGLRTLRRQHRLRRHDRADVRRRHAPLACLFMLVVAAAVIIGASTRNARRSCCTRSCTPCSRWTCSWRCSRHRRLFFFFVILSTIGAIGALFAIHARVREWNA